MSVIKVVGRGLRGLSFTDVARRSGAYGARPSDSDLVVMNRFATWVGSGGTFVGTGSELPAGGAPGQVLAKTGTEDGVAGWIDPPAGSASLAGLADVDGASWPPADGTVLKYSASSGKWLAQVDATGAGAGGVGSVAGYGSHAYWRLKIIADNGGPNLGLGNIEFRATPGGIDQAYDGTPISGGDFTNDYVAAYAFDDNRNSPWYSAQGATGWIGYHFPAAVEVGEVQIHYSRGDPAGAPRDFFVEYSDDGATWTTAWLVQNSTGWASEEDRLFRPPT